MEKSPYIRNGVRGFFEINFFLIPPLDLGGDERKTILNNRNYVI